jgi:hypothetical protein
LFVLSLSLVISFFSIQRFLTFHDMFFSHDLFYNIK